MLNTMIFRHEIPEEESERELSQKHPRIRKAEWHVILRVPMSTAESEDII